MGDVSLLILQSCYVMEEILEIKKGRHMKKKILAVLLAVVTMLSGFSAQAYAEANDLSEISPYYAGVSSVTSFMDIEDDCILVYSLEVIPFTDASLDRVHIEAELRTLGGRVEKTYDEDLTKYTRLYTFSKRRAVSEEGTYFLEYTLTCYKNSKVIDTISKTTRTATYIR